MELNELNLFLRNGVVYGTSSQKGQYEQAVSSAGPIDGVCGRWDLCQSIYPLPILHTFGCLRDYYFDSYHGHEEKNRPRLYDHVRVLPDLWSNGWLLN